MITSIKLFYRDSFPMVALYGAANANSDGWQCNVPAHEVLDGDPNTLPVEQQLTVAEAGKLIGFSSSFKARMAPAKKDIRMSELVSEISTNTGIPEPDVHRIVFNVLRNFKHVVAKGGQFNSSILRILPHAAPAPKSNASSSTSAARNSAVLLSMPNE
jgi:hypothetical protein